jgi:AcrR family transcriptional regulator
MSMSATPLRERKKAKTRSDLLATAHRLFRERGYEATTLESICDEAQVSVRTFFRYFVSKDDLALEVHRRAARYFRNEMTERGGDETAMTACRRILEELAKVMTDNPADKLPNQRMVQENPVLTAAYLMILQDFEDCLTDALANELRVDPSGDLRPRLVAATYFGGLRAVLRRWVQSDGREPLSSLVHQLTDFMDEHYGNRLVRQPVRRRQTPRRTGS